MNAYSIKLLKDKVIKLVTKEIDHSNPAALQSHLQELRALNEWLARFETPHPGKIH